MSKKVNLFGGENSEAQNALLQAFQDCAEDELKRRNNLTIKN